MKAVERPAEQQHNTHANPWAHKDSCNQKAKNCELQLLLSLPGALDVRAQQGAYCGPVGREPGWGDAPGGCV